MQKIIILGSTGNLGVQNLEVLNKYTDYFKIIALTCNKQEKLMQKQAKEFNIKNTANHPNIDMSEADIIINTLAGTVGIESTKQALRQNKILILANKESLIAEGSEIMKLAKASNLLKHLPAPNSKSSFIPHQNTSTPSLIPMDSEHNAIHEILQARPAKKIKKITIPCSGGPFLHKSLKELKNITASEALKHPRWTMGAKISIESATLLNKGMEVLEAHFLFQIPLEKIEVKIHPECQIHGIVEFEDGEKLAYLSKPDMREHIENCLRTAAKLPSTARKNIINFHSEIVQKYKLQDPDHKTFQGINLVLKAFKQGNMKNFLDKEEQVINSFLQGEIGFLDIFEKLSSCDNLKNLLA